MIYSSATVLVNPEGEVALTRAQVWNALVMKARDARLFLPPGLCTRCEITEESATHIVREATIAGEPVRELISFEPDTKVSFFQAAGPREGVVINEILEDSTGALQLRFYCYAGLRGKQANGPEEQAEQAMMDSERGFKTAVLSTLKRTRDLIAEGKL